MLRYKKNPPVNEGRWGRHKLDSDHRALVRKRSDTLGRGSVPQLYLTLAFELEHCSFNNRKEAIPSAPEANVRPSIERESTVTELE